MSEQTIKQEHTSAATSRNIVPAIHGKLQKHFEEKFFCAGNVNLDLGGGRYNKHTELLAEYGVENLVFDPHNRSDAHNRRVLCRLEQAGGADTVTLAKVLNVIKEPEVRLYVLKEANLHMKAGAQIFITVYEGAKKGPHPTRDGWQESRALSTYLPEVKRVFPNAKLSHGVIFASKES